MATTENTTANVTLDDNSMYQGTPVYVNPADNNAVFGLRIQAVPRQGDRLVKVAMRTSGRPDLISTYYQGTPELWWLLSDLTQLLDPMMDFKSGLQLRFSPTGLNR